MADSTSTRPLVWRWGRRVASVVGRSVLAAVSVVVTAYGGFQLSLAFLGSILPLPMSPLPPWMSFGKMISVLETLPPVRLVGPVVVDPVLDTGSLLTVSVSVGLLALGALGMTVAGIAPQLRQRARTTKEKEGSLSAALPSVHDVYSLFHKSQSELAQDAETFFVATGACIFMSWTATNIIIPQVADVGGFGILLVLMITVRIIPVLSLICAMLAVGHAGWYGYRRWKAQPSAQTDADSHTTPLDSEPSTDGTTEEGSD